MNPSADSEPTGGLADRPTAARIFVVKVEHTGGMAVGAKSCVNRGPRSGRRCCGSSECQ